MPFKLLAIPALLSLLGGGWWYAQEQNFSGTTPPIQVQQGGTGWGNIQAGTYLTGNGTGRLATSTCVDITGSAALCDGNDATGSGGSAAAVATSTNETTGRLAYWTSTSGTPATLGEVATTTLTATSPLSFSNPVVKVGGVDSILTIATTTNSLFTGSQGQVLAYTASGWTGVATTTFSTGLTYLHGNVTADLGTSIDISSETNLGDGTGLTFSGDTLNCDSASGSVQGCLLAADWTIFNNKISSSSLSSANTLLTYSGATGVFTASTSPTFTNASSTNLAITGLASNCNGTSALTTNAVGNVTCTAQPQGTVTAVSVVSANGFAGTSGGGATPALTLSTTITGLLQGNGTAISATTSVGSNYIKGPVSSIFAFDATGGAIATTSIGWNYIKGPASSIFAFDTSGNGIATTSIGVGYLTGLLPLSKGGTGAALSGANEMLFMNAGNTAVSSSGNWTNNGTLLTGLDYSLRSGTTTNLFSTTASSTNLFASRGGIATTSPWGFTIATTTLLSGASFGQVIASTTAANETATQTLSFETGNTQRHYLHANTLFNINATSSFPNEGYYDLYLIQDETGSRTCTFGTPNVLRWGSGTNATGATTTCSTAARSATHILFFVDKTLNKVTALASTTLSNAY